MTKDGYTIAAARPQDVGRLPAIERAAAELFPDEVLPAAGRDVNTEIEEFDEARREGRLWVALDPKGTAVGFALLESLDGVGHLAELDVHPAHGRRGLGRRLVAAVFEGCRARGATACTLTTFRHLAWNAPFYESAGFRMLKADELSPGLAAALEHEAQTGLDPNLRVAMRADLVD